MQWKYWVARQQPQSKPETSDFLFWLITVFSFRLYGLQQCQAHFRDRRNKIPWYACSDSKLEDGGDCRQYQIINENYQSRLYNRILLVNEYDGCIDVFLNLKLYDTILCLCHHCGGAPVRITISSLKKIHLNWSNRYDHLKVGYCVCLRMRKIFS